MAKPHFQAQLNEGVFSKVYAEAFLPPDTTKRGSTSTIINVTIKDDSPDFLLTAGEFFPCSLELKIKGENENDEKAFELEVAYTAHCHLISTTSPKGISKADDPDLYLLLNHFFPAVAAKANELLGYIGYRKAMIPLSFPAAMKLEKKS